MAYPTMYIVALYLRFSNKAVASFIRIDTNSLRAGFEIIGNFFDYLKVSRWAMDESSVGELNHNGRDAEYSWSSNSSVLAGWTSVANILEANETLLKQIAKLAKSREIRKEKTL